MIQRIPPKITITFYDQLKKIKTIIK